MGDFSPKVVSLPRLAGNPLVSVLITNYNYADFVGMAVESVLAQNYQSCEIVICDDGSTDNSLSVLSEFQKRDRSCTASLKESGQNMSTRILTNITMRLHKARRILLAEGLFNLAWESLVYLIKPIRLMGEAAIWWAYKVCARDGHLRVQVGENAFDLLPTDGGISKELALYKVHEPLATKVLQQMLSPGMVVVDIGSNLGYYALIEARRVGPEGRVIAIEPVPDNATVLSRNVALNRLANITVLQVAIGDHEGEAPIYLSDKSNSHSLVDGSQTRRGQLTVPLVTLDRLLTLLGIPRVDLIRMDIEGYETQALGGMLRTIERHSPHVFVELHPHLAGPQGVVAFLRRMEAFGYRVMCVVERQRDQAWRAWRLRVEKSTIAGLVNDQRIATENALTVVLQKNGHPGITDCEFGRH